MNSTYTPLDQLTPEHLGPEATDDDVRLYREAVRRVMASHDHDRDEESASEYVWNNGAIRFNAGNCYYCDRVTSDHTIIPAAGDDEGWAELAAEHEPECEWIVTRAHRR